MGIYDKKIAEFTRWAEPLPRPPEEEVWHTFEDYTAKVLFFHKGHRLSMSGSSWCGSTLEDAIQNAVKSALEYVEAYEVDENSTLQIIAVGCAYQYDRRLIRRADPNRSWDTDQYDNSSSAWYKSNRRLIAGPVVGYASDLNFAELPTKYIKRFEDL
jgi:hypothetical protein